jgi:hypothetical protein
MLRLEMSVPLAYDDARSFIRTLYPVPPILGGEAVENAYAAMGTGTDQLRARLSLRYGHFGTTATVHSLTCVIS